MCSKFGAISIKRFRFMAKNAKLGAQFENYRNNQGNKG
jgi:hypothetical protein